MASQNGEAAFNGNNPYIISYLAESKPESSTMPNSPFDILNKYRSHVRCFRQGRLIKGSFKPTVTTTTSTSQGLSAETIVELSKMRLLHGLSPQRANLFELPSGLSLQNLKDMELTYSLLCAAVNFSNQNFDCADRFLQNCIPFPSLPENPLRRVVKYFAESLREKIDIERGHIDLERRIYHLEESLLNHQPAILAVEQKLPSSQITQFTAVQTILEKVGTSKKIHLIDFGIKSGTLWSIMIEDLAHRASSPVELLKITSVGTSKDRIEKSGKRISSHAKTMNFPLSFKTVVSEIKDLREDLFEFDSDEVVALYCGLHLWTHLAWPDHLKSFLRFAKSLNPCVMVVNEIEACTNTLNFMDRFHEAFSYNLATFDCLETCLKGEEAMYGRIVEEVFFKDMIRNIIAADDDERFHRHEKIGFWRKMFGEFDLLEMELSDSSWYQASLLIKRSSCWDSCSLIKDGKCMIVGWKGTSLQSISSWKVHYD